jgi:hypothetical protein
MLPEVNHERSSKISCESSSELDTGSGIYTEVVTIWLMIFQRLNPERSLTGAIEKLRSGYFDDILDTRSSRVREEKILSGTGGYSRALNWLNLSRVEELHIFPLRFDE